MPTKPCRLCGEIKELTDFYMHNTAKDRRRNSCKSCDDVRNSAWKSANPEDRRLHVRRSTLRKKYNLTLEQYDSLLAAQGNRCACCKTDTPGGRSTVFIVDHDHDTGEIRGLLCSACNLGIGKLGDTVAGVSQALNYLQQTASS